MTKNTVLFDGEKTEKLNDFFRYQATEKEIYEKIKNNDEFYLRWFAISNEFNNTGFSEEESKRIKEIIYHNQDLKYDQNIRVFLIKHNILDPAIASIPNTLRKEFEFLENTSSNNNYVNIYKILNNDFFPYSNFEYDLFFKFLSAMNDSKINNLIQNSMLLFNLWNDNIGFFELLKTCSLNNQTLPELKQKTISRRLLNNNLPFSNEFLINNISSSAYIEYLFLITIIENKLEKNFSFPNYFYNNLFFKKYLENKKKDLVIVLKKKPLNHLIKINTESTIAFQNLLYKIDKDKISILRDIDRVNLLHRNVLDAEESNMLAISKIQGTINIENSKYILSNSKVDISLKVVEDEIFVYWNESK